jgi:hypothetical protein
VLRSAVDALIQCLYLSDLQREAEERKDAELGVAAFKRQLTTLRERCTALDSQIEHYRAVAGNLERGTFVVWSFGRHIFTSQ